METKPTKHFIIRSPSNQKCPETGVAPSWVRVPHLLVGVLCDRPCPGGTSSAGNGPCRTSSGRTVRAGRVRPSKTTAALAERGVEHLLADRSS